MVEIVLLFGIIDTPVLMTAFDTILTLIYIPMFAYNVEGKNGT